MRNYLSGRVNRASFGVPGLSTNQDLVVDVSGAIGVETSEPRTYIDTPEISIRGDILDADQFEGGLGYFLSKDNVGVKWVAASPIDLTFIRVYDDGVQVGPSSFTGLNFVGGVDKNFVTIAQDPLDPNLANINYDVRWIRFDYGANKAIATAFGPDGTYASIPGFGRSDAVGVTSIGIGTIQPQDDFQVGIGSTGVTINGPTGLVDAEIIKAKSIQVEGNLEVESLVVRPGFATLTDLDVLNTASIPVEYVGLSSIKEARVDILKAEQVLAGLTTLGYEDEDVFILNDLYIQGGLGTFSGDVFVGGDLTVQGETFFQQINAVNISISGIATINSVEAAGIAVTNFSASGFSTLTFYSFDTGFGTSLFLEGGVIGVATIGAVEANDATVGTGTFGSQVVTGVSSVGILTANSGFISTATAGILTVTGNSVLSGITTLGSPDEVTGFTTTRGDLFVGGDLDVAGDLIFEDLFGENLIITGVGTIRQLESEVGIIDALFAQNAQVTGVATVRRLETLFIKTLDMESRNIDNSGIVTTSGLVAGVGSVGIITGNQLSYGIGTFTYLDAGIGTVTQLFGENLNYSGLSQVNGTVFKNRDVEITRNLNVLGLTTFTGIGTFGEDLYVANDLFVGGKLFFEQIEGNNILITGVGTFKELNYDVGIGTSARIEKLDVTGIATLQNTDGIAGTFTRLYAEEFFVTDLGRGTGLPGNANIDFVNSIFITSGQVNSNRIEAASVGINTNLTVNQDTVLNRAEIQQSNTGIATVRDLTVTGISTVGFQTTKRSFTGLGTFTVLTVEETGTYEKDLIVEGTAFINDGIVIGVSTIQDLQFNAGVGTDLEVETSRTGVASVGLASITRAEITSLDAYETNVAISTIGFAEIGTGLGDGALLVTGINTFIGFTTFLGDVYVNGDLTVTGVTSFKQLDAAQSQIGILTVGTRLDANGIADFESVDISQDFQSTAGVSTLGFTTITSSLHIDNNLYVGGITTFDGVVDINKVEFVELAVTGIASIRELYVNVGVATRFDIDELNWNVGVGTDLTVTGFSTFVGFATFQDSVYIRDNLTVEKDAFVGSSLTVTDTITTNDLNVTGLSSVASANIGFATVGFASITDSYTGVATVGVLTVTDVTVTGITTFEGNIDIDANVDIERKLTVGELGVSGLATFTDIRVGVATIGFASITDAYVGASTIGFSSITELFSEDLTVVGTSTFVGFVTVTGDVFIDGNQTITGVSSFRQLDAEQSRIGILTIGKYINFLDAIQEPTGFTTLNRFSAQAGVITSVRAEEVNTGILTVTVDAQVDRNLIVTGITTLAGAGGTTTVGGDLYVQGDLYIEDDIFYDEITGRNLSITGVATIANLHVPDGPNSGIATVWNINGDELRYNVGVFTDLRVTTLESQRLISTSITASDGLDVTGLGTFRSEVEFQQEVEMDSTLLVLGETTINNTLIANDIQVVDKTTSQNLFVQTGIITDLTSTDINVSDIFITNELNSINLARFADVIVGSALSSPVGFFTDINNSGLITSKDVTVSGITSTFDLYVTNEATFEGEVKFDGDVTVLQNFNVVGFTSIKDFEARNGKVGVVTAEVLQTDAFFIDAITGVGLTVGAAAEFTRGVTVEPVLQVTGAFGDPNTGTFLAGIATIGTLSGEEIQYDLAQFDSTTTNGLNVNNGVDPADRVNIQGYLDVGFGLDVGGNADIGQNLDVAGTVDANGGVFNVLDVKSVTNLNKLNYAAGVGTDAEITGIATIAYANIIEANIGVATVGLVTITNASVGVITAYTRYDLSDTMTQMSFKAETNTVAAVSVYSIDPQEYGSFEISVDAREAGNVYSTKIHCVFDNNPIPNPLYNDYSTVFNSIPVTDVDIIPVSANQSDIVFNSANANTTEYVVNITATRRYT